MANPDVIWSIYAVSIISIITVSARPNTMEESLRLLQDSITNMQKNFAGQLTGLGQETITNFPFRVPNVNAQQQSGHGIPLGAFLFFNGIPNKESVRYNNNNFHNQEPQNTNFENPQNQRYPSVSGKRNHQSGYNHNQFKPLSDQSSASATASASSSSYGGNSNENNEYPTGNMYPISNQDSDKYTNYNQQGHPNSHNREHNHEHPHRHNYGNNYHNNRPQHGYDHEYPNHKRHNQAGGYRPDFERYPNQEVSYHNGNPTFNPGNMYPEDRKHESQNFNQFTTNRPNSNYRERNVQHGKPVHQPSKDYDRESYEGSSQNYQILPNKPFSNRGPSKNVPVQSENSVYTNTSHLDNLKPVIESIDDIVPPNIPQNLTTAQDINASIDKTATSGNSQESVEKTTTVKETKTVVKKTDGKVTSVEESADGDQIYSIDIRNGDGSITDQNITSVSVVPSVSSVPSVPSSP